MNFGIILSNRCNRCQGFTFRLATMSDATEQLQRLTEEVLPLLSQM